MDKSKEYGIVLEGGGARGAYQVGVWKALREQGIKIKGVVGTSVGALNGALFCMDAYDEAIEIWENIKYSKVMQVEDDIIEQVVKLDLKNIKMNIVKDIGKLFSDGGFDITPLKNMITDIICEDRMRSSQVEFGLVTVSVTDRKSIEIFLDDIPEGLLADYLLASSFLPVFKGERLHGKRYIDGGIHNNVPINMLLDRGYKDIIVIRIYGIGIERKVKLDDDINIIEISPEADLGGILEFNRVKSKRNILLGYYDALRAIKGLKGKKYYIQPMHKNGYYLNKLINVSDEVKERIIEMYDIAGPIERGLLESVYPDMAKTLKLDKDWDYVDLYIRILEVVAIRLRLSKFYEYTDDELLLMVKKVIREADEDNIILSSKPVMSLLILLIKDL